jgi:hypothetical protein
VLRGAVFPIVVVALVTLDESWFYWDIDWEQ